MNKYLSGFQHKYAEGNQLCSDPTILIGHRTDDDDDDDSTEIGKYYQLIQNKEKN